LNIYTINPLVDRRWDELVARHPRASAFHQRGWLNALACTYHYQPLAITSTPPDKPLMDGIVLCRVSSWLTGTRLVSLPFSDHCEPLLNEPGDLIDFSKWLRAESDKEQWKYIELRPVSKVRDTEGGLCKTGSFCFHELDLGPSTGQLFDGLHKDCFQRKIRRAENERLSYEVGCSERAVSDFYQLLLMTRRRHQMLPQPRAWFRNLIESMGDKVQIRMARKDGTPIAALLTLKHAGSVIYKYGCSNSRFHNLGGMPLLFWRLIEESKAEGASKIDFGRSDLDNQGLIVFKDRLGAQRKALTYYRYPKPKQKDKNAAWNLGRIRRLFSVLPGPVSSTAGRILYRHVG
jgi:hypothetical protein